MKRSLIPTKGKKSVPRLAVNAATSGRSSLGHSSLGANSISIKRLSMPQTVSSFTSYEKYCQLLRRNQALAKENALLKENVRLLKMDLQSNNSKRASLKSPEKIYKKAIEVCDQIQSEQKALGDGVSLTYGRIVNSLSDFSDDILNNIQYPNESHNSEGEGGRDGGGECPPEDGRGGSSFYMSSEDREESRRGSIQRARDYFHGFSELSTILEVSASSSRASFPMIEPSTYSPNSPQIRCCTATSSEDVEGAESSNHPTHDDIADEHQEINQTLAVTEAHLAELTLEPEPSEWDAIWDIFDPPGVRETPVEVSVKEALKAQDKKTAEAVAAPFPRRVLRSRQASAPLATIVEEEESATTEKPSQGDRRLEGRHRKGQTETKIIESEGRVLRKRSVRK